MHTDFTLHAVWCHGAADDVIPIPCAEDILDSLGSSAEIPLLKSECRFYNSLRHTTLDNELNNVASWFQDILG